MDTKRSPRNFFEAVASPVIYDEDSPYSLMVYHMNRLVADHYSSIKTLGEKLNDDLSVRIKKEILDEFSSYGAFLLQQIPAIKERILHNVDSYFFSYPNRNEAFTHLNEALADLYYFARKTLNYAPQSKYTIADLKELRARAEKITIIERVTGSNSDDVIEYYHALVDHTVDACRQLARRQASKFIMHMVDYISREFDLDAPFATIYNDDVSYPVIPDLPRYLHPLVELMAENNHNKWMETRRAQGWTYGPERDDAKKTTPCMVPYSDLPESEKDVDRRSCVETIVFILRNGFRIVKF